MKTIGTIIVGATLIFSAIAVVVFFTRDRQPQAPAEISAPDSLASQNFSSPKRGGSETVRPRTPPPAPVAFVQAPNEKVSAAMSETVVKNLIANVRVAAAKGDDATRKILLNGLKKDAPTACRLLQSEISSATDPATKSVLNDILDDLKGEAR